MVKLTVALTTKNRSLYLKYAIEAILNQTYKDFLLIVIDDASSDDTSKIIGMYKDNRIRYIKNDKNLGLMNNLNNALKLCKSEYLLITHDDDIMENEFLKEEMTVMEGNPDFSIVSTNIKLIDNNGKIIKTKLYPLKKKGIQIYGQYDFIKEFARGNKYIACPTVMFRMAFMRSRGLSFNPEIISAADSYLWMEINTYKNKMAIIKEPLYKYRIHPDQDNIKNVITAHFLLFKHAMPLFQKSGLTDYLPLLRSDFFRIIFFTSLVQYVKGQISKNDVLICLHKMKTSSIWPRILPFTTVLLLRSLILPDILIRPAFTALYRSKKSIDFY